MSAQSGIGVSQELSRQFAEASSSGSVRALKVSIENEQLVSSASVPLTEGVSATEDFTLLAELLQPTTPAYVLYRLDPPTESASAADCPWLFISYVPDEAKVREKMLYASTRATCTRQLGDSRFKDSLFATSKSDLTPDGYRAHLASQGASAPRTARERELEEVRLAEGISATSQGTGARSSNVWGASSGQGTASSAGGNAGVGLKWSSEAEERLESWATDAAGAKAAQFVIDLTSETVVPSPHADGTLSFPDSEPSYTFFRHVSGADDAGPSYAFIYACPSKSPVRSRLLYSSSSGAVAGRAASHGVTVSKKIETSDPSEVNEAFIAAELGLAPPAHDEKPKFAKPSRPGRKR